MKKSKIKITKQEVFWVESKNFNACISNDFYNQDSKYPIVMSVEHTKSKNKCFSEMYIDKDEALYDFQNFVAASTSTTTETVAKEYQHTELEDLIELFGKTIH